MAWLATARKAAVAMVAVSKPANGPFDMTDMQTVAMPNLGKLQDVRFGFIKRDLLNDLKAGEAAHAGCQLLAHNSSRLLCKHGKERKKPHQQKAADLITGGAAGPRRSEIESASQSSRTARTVGTEVLQEGQRERDCGLDWQLWALASVRDNCAARTWDAAAQKEAPAHQRGRRRAPQAVGASPAAKRVNTQACVAHCAVTAAHGCG